MTPLSERSSRVLDAAKLKRRSGRHAAERFLAEGPNLVEAAIRRGLAEEVFATEAAAARFHDLVAGAGPQIVTERAMKALSDTVTPAGLVAVCARPRTDLDDVLAGSPALLAVGVDIADPGNAGTLIRLADAMGASAAVFAGDSVDPYNGKCVRSSAGSIFSLPVLIDADAPALIDRLRGAGLQVLATTLTGEVCLDDADELLGAPTAWLFGPEARGLSEDIADRADRRVAIPMAGCVDSLNVAVAAAICLYQSARAQRSLRLGGWTST